MNKETTLVLIRHGETEWNKAGRYQGHDDSPLTTRGLAQARAATEALSDESFHAIYSSDLGRAQQTAAVIAEKIAGEVHVDPRLREQHYGLLQGLNKPDARKTDPDFFISLNKGNPQYVPKGGESRQQRHERVIQALEKIADKHSGEHILIVTHGGVVDSLLRETLGIPLEAPRHYSLYNLAINRFLRLEQVWTLVSWGDVSHLKSVGATDAASSFTA